MRSCRKENITRRGLPNIYPEHAELLTITGGTRLTIPAGETTATETVTVNAINNDIYGGNRWIVFNGSLCCSVTLAGSPITLWIDDDDPKPTLSLTLSQSSVSEHGGTSTVTATLSAPTGVANRENRPVTVEVEVSPVSPAEEGDFTLTGTTLEIAAGQTTSTGTVTVTAVDNDVDAPDKQVEVRAASVWSGRLNLEDPMAQTMTLNDDDEATATPDFSDCSPSTAYVVLATPQRGLVTAPWSVTKNRSSMAEGECATVTLATTTGVAFDAAEPVTLAVVGKMGGGTGTDPGDIAISVHGRTLTPVMRRVQLGIDLNHDGAVDSDDKVLAEHYVFEIPAGENSVVVTATAVDDAEEEGQEPVSFVFLHDGKIANSATWSTDHLNIHASDRRGVDDPRVSVAGAEAYESGTGADAAMTFEVTLSRSKTATVTVDYATANGTATAGADYTTASGTLTFAAGETTQTVEVTIHDDTVADDGETFTLTLSNPSGAALGDAEATGTIRNTEAGPDAEPAVVLPPLTASFDNVPSEHDGEGAFSLQVEFSEEIGISYASLRDEAFTVTHGNVTRARRVDGRHDLWEITVEPDSDEAVTITLPGNRDCGTAGAVCTRGGAPRPLSNSPSATVEGPPDEPLTASFSGMPVSHDGESAFTFGLTFSEEPKVSYRTLRDEAFEVTGGAVRKAQRKQQGSNQGWNITVEADGGGTVTIRLPETTDCNATGAICTADGRPLSNSLSATVAGPTTTLNFAHFANGDGITSEVVLVNVAPQPVRPTLYFYDQQGEPIAVESLLDIGSDLEIQNDGGLTIWTETEPLGVLTIPTHGRGDLVSGSVKVVSDGPIGGVLRFDLPGIGETVVEPSPSVSDVLFPVRRQEGGINTAVAIHNLESSPGLVRCRLMQEGVLRDSAPIPLAANGQTSWTIDEAFPAAYTSDFVGSVRCDAVGEGRFSAVALEMDPGTRVFTTLPVVPVPEMPDRE